MDEIAIINKCSVLSDDNVQAVIPAVQAQINEDFCGKLTGPAPTLTPGGYLGIYDPSTGQWTRSPRLQIGKLNHRARHHGRTAWHAVHGVRQRLRKAG
jgi:hypothetical protein